MEKFIFRAAYIHDKSEISRVVLLFYIVNFE